MFIPTHRDEDGQSPAESSDLVLVINDTQTLLMLCSKCG
jgi:hypothetical protein